MRELRRKRDSVEARKALGEVKAMAQREARPENNLVPPIIAAVKAYCTIGEIADVLKGVWGEHTEVRLM